MKKWNVPEQPDPDLAPQAFGANPDPRGRNAPVPSRQQARQIASEPVHGNGAADATTGQLPPDRPADQGLSTGGRERRGWRGRRAATTEDSTHPNRASRVWVDLAVGGLFVLLLLIFAAQNTSEYRFSLFFWHFAMPVGFAVLAAAIVGLVVMATVSGIWIVQLRKMIRRLNRG